MTNPDNEYFDQQGMPIDDNATSPINDLGFKPYAFLSNVGGKQTSLKEIAQEEKPKGKFDREVTTSRKSNIQNPGDIVIFNNSNVDRAEKTGRLERPHTVSIHDINSRVLKTSNTTIAISKTMKRPETSKVPELPDIFDSSSRRPLTAM